MERNVKIKVTWNLFKKMSITTLWYLGIFALTITILQVIFHITNTDSTIVFTETTIKSSQIFLLIIGIIYPLLYLPHYLAMGVTRKQFAVGLFAAAVLLSCCISILQIPLQLMDKTFMPLEILSNAAYGALAFLSGWTAAIGFQFMRVIPIIAGIVCANVVFYGLQFLSPLHIPPLVHLLIIAATLCLVWFLLLQAFKRVAVKC